MSGAHDRDASATIVEHLLVVGGPSPSVYGDRDRADLDGTEEAVEKFWSVAEEQKHAFFLPDVQFAKGITDSVGPLEQLVIAHLVVAAFNGDALAAPLLDVTIDEVGGDVECFRKSDQERCYLPRYGWRPTFNYSVRRAEYNTRLKW